MSLYRVMRRVAGKTLRTIPWVRRQMDASCDYALITPQQASMMRTGGWFSPLTARRQQRAYEALLNEMREGRARTDLAVAAQAIEAVELPTLSLLEVGCGGGYYSEILAHIPATRVDYTGLDYSAAMIARARESYPAARFVTGDATALEFGDGEFDVVFNGVSLMHIPDWRAAIAESRRVARSACIFHSVPVLENHPTAHVRKYAYGGLVVEMIFNRDELVSAFEKAGLRVTRSWPTIEYDVGHILGESSHAETFLCVPK